MEEKIEDKEKGKKELTVKIEVDEMEKFLDQAAGKLSEEMNVKGFRPGKAPREVVENSFGKEKLWAEAAKFAVEETYPRAIENNELFPISQPEIEFSQLAPGNPLKYKAVFFVMPEFDLPDYKKIAEEVSEKEDEEVEVSDKEVDETLDRIRESRATSKEVDRGAKEDDKVKISFKGLVDGEEEMGEDDFQFTLGTGRFDLLEGFEEKIIGMKPGESKSFKIKISEEDSNEELAGKEIEFDLDLESVFEKEMPELNDEFANSLHGDISNLKELKEKIKEGIGSEKEAKNNEALRMKLVNELIKKTDIELPEILVERELENMENQMNMQLQQSGLTFDDYLERIDKKREDLREEWRSKAEDNVAAAIILHKIAEEEKIEVTDEEIEKEVDKHFQVSGRSREDEDEDSLQRLRSYVHDILKNDKIFDFLLK